MVQASDRLVLSFLGGFQVRAESGAKIRVRTLGNACPLVFASAALAIGIPGLLTPTPSPTVFDLPSGVPPANDYLNGIHLIDNGSFISGGSIHGMGGIPDRAGTEPPAPAGRWSRGNDSRSPSTGSSFRTGPAFRMGWAPPPPAPYPETKCLI